MFHMPKSATLSSAAPTSSRGSGVRKPAHGARSSGMTAKQIDPALRRAIVQGDVEAPLTVLVKLDTKHSGFGKFKVTNRPGSARERAFTEEVAAEVENAAASGDYQILSTAANVGVATVLASTEIVKHLLRSAKVTGMKLKAG
ncbi:hypothetical protein HQS1_46030 [Delftia lacustris]|nr:hypothetical protein HQS1_46030 [Delftia lacustris]